MDHPGLLLVLLLTQFTPLHHAPQHTAALHAAPVPPDAVRVQAIYGNNVRHVQILENLIV